MALHRQVKVNMVLYLPIKVNMVLHPRAKVNMVLLPLGKVKANTVRRLPWVEPAMALKMLKAISVS